MQSRGDAEPAETDAESFHTFVRVDVRDEFLEINLTSRNKYPSVKCDSASVSASLANVLIRGRLCGSFLCISERSKRSISIGRPETTNSEVCVLNLILPF
jgi:hypothetical protein